MSARPGLAEPFEEWRGDAYAILSYEEHRAARHPIPECAVRNDERRDPERGRRFPAVERTEQGDAVDMSTTDSAPRESDQPSATSIPERVSGSQTDRKRSSLPVSTLRVAFAMSFVIYWIWSALSYPFFDTTAEDFPFVERSPESLASSAVVVALVAAVAFMGWLKNRTEFRRAVKAVEQGSTSRIAPHIHQFLERIDPTFAERKDEWSRRAAEFVEKDPASPDSLREAVSQYFARIAPTMAFLLSSKKRPIVRLRGAIERLPESVRRNEAREWMAPTRSSFHIWFLVFWPTYLVVDVAEWIIGRSYWGGIRLEAFFASVAVTLVSIVIATIVRVQRTRKDFGVSLEGASTVGLSGLAIAEVVVNGPRIVTHSLGVRLARIFLFLRMRKWITTILFVLALLLLPRAFVALYCVMPWTSSCATLF